MSFQKIKLAFANDGRVARISLAAPKANILDRAMMAELRAAFRECEPRELNAIVVDAEGPNFSFGASVQEHLPSEIGATLKGLHALLLAISKAGAPVIAAVRGLCLGGGFELALACDLIFSDINASFGAPEVKLGVFAPAASVLLPVRTGQALAARLLLTGETVNAADALRAGIVARTARTENFSSELDSWLQENFCDRSPVGQRFASRAVRLPLLRALEVDLPLMEQIYLNELMPMPGATEGIEAFLEKREPRWGATLTSAH